MVAYGDVSFALVLCPVAARVLCYSTLAILCRRILYIFGYYGGSFLRRYSMDMSAIMPISGYWAGFSCGDHTSITS